MKAETVMKLETVKKLQDAERRLVDAYAEYAHALGECVDVTWICANRFGFERGLAGLAEMRDGVREWRRDITSKTQLVVHSAEALGSVASGMAIKDMEPEELAELGDSMAGDLTPEMYASLDAEAREGWRIWRKRLGLPPLPEPETEPDEAGDGACSAPASTGVVGEMSEDPQFPGWTGWPTEGGRQ